MQILSSNRRRWLILLALAVMAAYLGAAIAVDAERLTWGIGRLGSGGIALLLALSLVNYGLRYWRWAGYLQVLGHRLPLGRHALYYLGGFAFTVTPGKAGEALRGAYLSAHGVPWRHSFAALFAERLLDVLAICALVALTAGQLADWRGAGLAVAALVLLLAWLLGRPGLPRWLDSRSPGLPSSLARAVQMLSKWLAAAAQLLSPARLFPALLLGMVAWGVEGYGLYWLAQGLDMDLTPEAGIAIYSISVLAGAAAFFMPGGLGGMEVAMTALLIAAGSDLATAFVITVLCRFATLWFAVLIGLAALLWLESRPLKTIGSIA